MNMIDLLVDVRMAKISSVKTSISIRVRVCSLANATLKQVKRCSDFGSKTCPHTK